MFISYEDTSGEKLVGVLEIKSKTNQKKGFVALKMFKQRIISQL